MDTTGTGDINNRLEFLKKLQVVTNKIHATNNTDEIMLEMSQDICDLFSCDRLTIYAVGEDKQSIVSKVKTGLNSFKDLKLPISEHSVAGYVAETRKVVNIDDVYDDLELKSYSPVMKFLKEVDRRTGYRSKQMLVAPIIDTQSDELRGVVQLINSRHDTLFPALAEEGVQGLAQTLAVAFAQRQKPRQTMHSKYDALVTDAVISADSGTSANWFARYIHPRGTQKTSVSGNLGSMVPGAAYALAAKFACPDRLSVGFVGAGAMQMLGINALITAKHYYDTWDDPRMVLCVLNNGDLNQVTWEMRAMAGNPRFEGSQALPEFPFADYAELLGLVGVRVEEPDAVGAAWDTVLAADRPAVLEVMCDPNVPTVPGHLTIGEATNYIEALAKGDPDAAQVVLQSARELWESASGTMKAAISERLG